MKQASRIKTEGTVVREVVTPDAVERRSEDGGRRSEGGVPYEPGEITAAWGMAVKGLYNQVAFGAMLCELDAVISRVRPRSENGQISGREDGLKAWLNDNCPTVNYKTAMRWKGMAEVACAALQEAGTPMPARLIPVAAGMLPPDGESFDFDKGKVALEKLLNGRSQRDLMAALRGPGRPRGTPSAGRRALTAAEKTDHAWTEIKELLGKVAAYTQGPWIEMLPEDRREWAARTMKDLATCFRDGRPFEAGTPNAER
jgi:hypothetical protein